MDEYRRDLPLTVHQVGSEEYLVHTEKAYSEYQTCFDGYRSLNVLCHSYLSNIFSFHKNSLRGIES